MKRLIKLVFLIFLIVTIFAGFFVYKVLSGQVDSKEIYFNQYVDHDFNHEIKSSDSDIFKGIVFIRARNTSGKFTYKLRNSKDIIVSEGELSNIGKIIKLEEKNEKYTVEIKANRMGDVGPLAEIKIVTFKY